MVSLLDVLLIMSDILAAAAASALALETFDQSVLKTQNVRYCCELYTQCFVLESDRSNARNGILSRSFRDQTGNFILINS